jgi:antitoxin PrlF
MIIASMTSKGQVTVPLKIRIYLGLNTGDKLEFLPLPDGNVMLAPINADVQELKGMLPKPKKTVSIEKMNTIIKKRRTVHARNRH